MFGTKAREGLKIKPFLTGTGEELTEVNAGS